MMGTGGGIVSSLVDGTHGVWHSGLLPPTLLLAAWLLQWVIQRRISAIFLAIVGGVMLLTLALAYVRSALEETSTQRSGCPTSEGLACGVGFVDVTYALNATFTILSFLILVALTAMVELILTLRTTVGGWFPSRRRPTTPNRAVATVEQGRSRVRRSRQVAPDPPEAEAD
jgi:hypothetical protein